MGAEEWVGMTASVVMASYNHASRLHVTLASIEVQPAQFDREVIVVDDGSTDETAQVVAAFPRVRYVRSAKTSGQHANPGPARNVAYQQATGDVLIMQSDDVYHVTPNAIDQLVAMVEHRPDHAVFATVQNIAHDGTPLETYCSRRRPRPYFFLGAATREAVLSVGGNDEAFDEPGYEDKWFNDCLRHGAGLKFLFTGHVVGHHQDHPRPFAQYGNNKYERMHQLYVQRVQDATSGRHPWAARQSRLRCAT